MICGSTLGWEKAIRWTKSRCAGRTARARLCAAFRPISFTRSSKARESKARLRYLLPTRAHLSREFDSRSKSLGTLLHAINIEGDVYGTAVQGSGVLWAGLLLPARFDLDRGGGRAEQLGIGTTEGR